MILDARAPLAKVLIEDGRLRAVLLRFAITTLGILLCSPTDARYWPSCARSSEHVRYRSPPHDGTTEIAQARRGR
jgi:hypothetical protein